jgi:NTE family protein
MEPKVGLALGSGGARGFAHIGVLKVLKEEAIPIHCIAGSSMGSLVGAIFAVHQNPHMMEKVATHLKPKHWVDFTVPKMGLVAGEKVRELIRLLTHGKRLEELFLPVAIVATDLETGKEVIFTEGPIDKAVRASIAIPGIFNPVVENGRVLVDGGVVTRVPITTLKAMGADLVIAVDVVAEVPKIEIQSLFDVISQTIDVMERQLYKTQAEHADVFIQPKVGHISSTDFTKAAECIAAGEKAARDKLAEIRRLIQSWPAKPRE